MTLPSNRMQRYSLWLVPSGRTYRRLHAAIRSFAAECHTPAFVPHVTLLGEVICSLQRLKEHSRCICRSVRPFAVESSGAGTSQTYYRSIFLSILETPSLITLHSRMRARFGIRKGSKQPYSPHLSLVYGYLNPQRKADVLSRADLIHPVRFVARGIWLVLVSGPPRTWVVIERIPFGGRR